ncbi:MAG: pseudouridine synthase [Bacilli bacterium]
MERIQKIIAESGYCSRRKAEELIKIGKVFVNGQRVTELGTKAAGSDEIMVNNEIISREEKEYYLFNKPRGVVSTTADDKNRKTVLDFFNTEKRIYPVGRLDYDTTGLMILTNDGEFANLMMHPSSKIDKFYVAKVEGIVTGEEVKALKKGVLIDNKKVYPARVKLKKIDKKSVTSILEITIHDGKNHEVKRLLEAVGHNVLKLKRESFGFLTLGNLKSGEKRNLSVKEVKQLYNMAINK